MLACISRSEMHSLKVFLLLLYHSVKFERVILLLGHVPRNFSGETDLVYMLGLLTGGVARLTDSMAGDICLPIRLLCVVIAIFERI